MDNVLFCVIFCGWEHTETFIWSSIAVISDHVTAHVDSMRVSSDFCCRLHAACPSQQIKSDCWQCHSRLASPLGLSPCQHTRTWHTAHSAHTSGQRSQANSMLQHNVKRALQSALYQMTGQCSFSLPLQQAYLYWRFDGCPTLQA